MAHKNRKNTKPAVSVNNAVLAPTTEPAVISAEPAVSAEPATSAVTEPVVTDKALDASATVSTRPVSLTPLQLLVGMMVMAIYKPMANIIAGTYAARIVEIISAENQTLVIAEFFYLMPTSRVPKYERNTLLWYPDTLCFRDCTNNGAPLRLAPYDPAHKQSVEFTNAELTITHNGQYTPLIGQSMLTASRAKTSAKK